MGLLDSRREFGQNSENDQRQQLNDQTKKFLRSLIKGGPLALKGDPLVPEVGASSASGEIISMHNKNKNVIEPFKESGEFKLTKEQKTQIDSLKNRAEEKLRSQMHISQETRYKMLERSIDPNEYSSLCEQIKLEIIKPASLRKLRGGPDQFLANGEALIKELTDWRTTWEMLAKKSPEEIQEEIWKAINEVKNSYEEVKEAVNCAEGYKDEYVLAQQCGIDIDDFNKLVDSVSKRNEELNQLQYDLDRLTGQTGGERGQTDGERGEMTISSAEMLFSRIKTWKNISMFKENCNKLYENIGKLDKANKVRKMDNCQKKVQNNIIKIEQFESGSSGRSINGIPLTDVIRGLKESVQNLDRQAQQYRDNWEEVRSQQNVSDIQIDEVIDAIRQFEEANAQLEKIIATLDKGKGKAVERSTMAGIEFSHEQKDLPGEKGVVRPLSRDVGIDTRDRATEDAKEEEQRKFLRELDEVKTEIRQIDGELKNLEDRKIPDRPSAEVDQWRYRRMMRELIDTLDTSDALNHCCGMSDEELVQKKDAEQDLLQLRSDQRDLERRRTSMTDKHSIESLDEITREIDSIQSNIHIIEIEQYMREMISDPEFRENVRNLRYGELYREKLENCRNRIEYLNGWFEDNNNKDRNSFSAAYKDYQNLFRRAENLDKSLQQVSLKTIMEEKKCSIGIGEIYGISKEIDTFSSTYKRILEATFSKIREIWNELDDSSESDQSRQFSGLYEECCKAWEKSHEDYGIVFGAYRSHNENARKYLSGARKTVDGSIQKVNSSVEFLDTLVEVMAQKADESWYKLYLNGQDQHTGLNKEKISDERKRCLKAYEDYKDKCEEYKSYLKFCEVYEANCKKYEDNPEKYEITREEYEARREEYKRDLKNYRDRIVGDVEESFNTFIERVDVFLNILRKLKETTNRLRRQVEYNAYLMEREDDI